MRNEKLSTIPKKESDEFIKSSVEDLVPTPGKSVTFSNPLFNSNYDFTSSDNESLFDEDVSEDNVKIYLNPLFEFDDEYISSDVNPFFDEVLENIENKDSYLDEPDLLVTPLFDDLFDLEYNKNDLKKILYDAPIDDLMTEDKIFDPGGDIDEIDAFLDIDTSTDIRTVTMTQREIYSILRVCLVMIQPLIPLPRCS
nr:hypothetical protein [Tanacetum cinerariifolium]